VAGRGWARAQRARALIGPSQLPALGIWTIVSALRDKLDEGRLARRATSWTGLVLLAGSLSIDNLVVGFSLGLGGFDPLMLATTIAVFSMAFTWIGLHLGSAGRRHWKRQPASALAFSC
jgi:putative Mn2+ efflux pump MntP